MPELLLPRFFLTLRQPATGTKEWTFKTTYINISSPLVTAGDSLATTEQAIQTIGMHIVEADELLGSFQPTVSGTDARGGQWR
jgi:hypothetical protein